MTDAGSMVFFVGLFLLGVILVIWCVEVFIEALAQSAVSLGISGFFLAVILAGVDVENAVLGITAAFVDLPDLALGTVFGESLFVLAIAVGIAGLFVPFRMDVPRGYLLMLLLVALPALALSLTGTIGRVEGIALLALFVLLIVAIFLQERRTETTYLLSTEVGEAVGLEAEGEPDGGTPAGEYTHEDKDNAVSDRWDLDVDLDLDEFVPELSNRSGLFNLGVAVLAIIGMTIGSMFTVVSGEGIFAALGISGLAFGATVLSFIASIEELALTVEPVRQGRPHLAVGNVVGSTVFYTTANIGLIAILHPVSTTGAVLTIHWPIFFVCLVVVMGMLARGRVTRTGGVLLIALYVTYWVVNYM